MCNGRWLETDLRATHEFEVMVSAVVPVDFVAGFKAESEDTRIEFNAATRIKDAIGVAISESPELIGKAPRRGRPAYAKVQDSTFKNNEGPDGAGGLDLWSKKPMEQPEVGADRRGCTSHSGESCCCIALEVVR